LPPITFTGFAAVVIQNCFNYDVSWTTSHNDMLGIAAPNDHKPAPLAKRNAFGDA